MCVSSAEFPLQCHHLNQMLGFSSRHELSGVVWPCVLIAIKMLRKYSYNDPRGSGKWVLFFRYFVDFSECLPIGKFPQNYNLWHYCINSRRSIVMFPSVKRVRASFTLIYCFSKRLDLFYIRTILCSVSTSCLSSIHRWYYGLFYWTPILCICYLRTWLLGLIL